MSNYEAELTLHVKLTREPDDDEAEAVAEEIEGHLREMVLANIGLNPEGKYRTRIIVRDAEVTGWRTVRS